MCNSRVETAQRVAKEFHIPEVVDDWAELALPSEIETAWTVEKAFIGAVVAGGHPEPSFETGVKYLEFTGAVNLSARGGHAVELPLP